jgi:hypothetical protein
MSTTAQRYYWTTIKVQEKDDVSWGVIFFLSFLYFILLTVLLDYHSG